MQDLATRLDVDLSCLLKSDPMLSKKDSRWVSGEPGGKGIQVYWHSRTLAWHYHVPPSSDKRRKKRKKNGYARPNIAGYFLSPEACLSNAQLHWRHLVVPEPARSVIGAARPFVGVAPLSRSTGNSRKKAGM